MPSEDDLNLWREDPLLNEHHEHWHLVYPFAGRPGHGNGFGDRHGELFAYMHQQMLARYHAERRSVGLPPVVPLDNYFASLPYSYNPGDLAWFVAGALHTYGDRPAGAMLSDVTVKEFATQPGRKLADQDLFRARLLDAASSGTFGGKSARLPVDMNKLPEATEATTRSVDPAFYGELHNDGHIHIAVHNNKKPYGVLLHEATAIRDPVFYAWHKHIDTIFRTWQDKQSPYELLDGPDVLIRSGATNSGAASSMDIILCQEDGLPSSFDGNALGSELFGYSDDPHLNKWNSDFSLSTVKTSSGVSVSTTDELNTEIRQRTISPLSPDGTKEEQIIDYLSHKDFYYFIRVQNRSRDPNSVTVRIFLAPELDINDPRSWIEMDKFRYHLQGSAKAVIFRPASLSSVVRKPVLRPRNLEPQYREPGKSAQSTWCDCGWPYTLLLPRGSLQGMEFRLFVTFSSGNDLSPLSSNEECSSPSYCGLQDSSYPDKRSMGYPFDRPFAGPISTTIDAHHNMASRIIRIKCVQF